VILVHGAQAVGVREARHLIVEAEVQKQRFATF